MHKAYEMSIENVSILNGYNFGPERHTEIEKKNIEGRSVDFLNFLPNFLMSLNFEIMLHKG